MGPVRGTAGIVLLCIVFINNIIETLSHPQCLDFRAPFKPSTALNFCTEYSDLGCCGRSTDERVKSEYEDIQSELRASDWNQCKDYIKSILCQRCSPYAAHIFDAESDGKPKLFPGLSTAYCGSFYDKCHQIVWFLDPMLSAVTVLGSKKRFCDKVSLPDQDYSYPDILTNFDPLTSNTPSSDPSSTPGCLCLKEIKGGLANPLYARPAWDGSGRVFVIEQVGRVHIYDAVHSQWKGIFLDFTKKAFASAWPGDERGFLGMAFHPRYKTNGRFFIFYSMKVKKGDASIPEELKSYPVASKVIVSEMKVKQDDPEKADMSSEKLLLELFQPHENHNGGEMFFGSDGYLYTFHGDGGGAGDPMRAGQNKAKLYGKVLRLDIDSDPSKPYTIPPDNPFVGDSNARPEIYAYGVRNIWRCGIDRGDNKTGESKGILCGDVGQGKYEEIDILKKGANYGWNGKEGFECFNQSLCTEMGGDELPITAYNHSVGKSICGGVFYRGCENPSLNGQYIYGDYESRRLFSLTESNGVWTNKDVQLCGKDLCQGNLLNTVNGKILSFGEDEAGEIYVLTSPRAFSRFKTGSMLKFVDPVMRNDPGSCTSNHDVSDRAPLPQRRSIVKIGNTTESTPTECYNCSDLSKNDACFTHGLHLSTHLLWIVLTVLSIVL